MPRAALVGILVLLAASACDSQRSEREPLALSPRLDSLTLVDAGVLALRYTLAVDKDTTTIDLDPQLVDALYRAIGRVRASEYAARVEGIRAFPLYPANEIYVLTDPSAAWTAAWARGEARTGYAPVDERVSGRGFSVARFYEGQQYDTAVLATDRALNTLALSRQLEAVPDVRDAGPNARVGDGDDIEAERAESGWRLDFSRGSGDCPSGCIHRAYWTFRVGDDGAVTYLGTRER